MFQPSSSATNQHGMVLITALIFLVILTLIGVSLSNSGTLEERIGRNIRDQDIAYAAAEAALRDAELHIYGGYQWPYAPVKLIDFNPNCDNGLCDPVTSSPVNAAQLNFFEDSTGFGTKAIGLGHVTGSPEVQHVADQPRYLIEILPTKLGPVTGSTTNKIFRITAQAIGQSSSTRIVLQEIYISPNELE